MDEDSFDVDAFCETIFAYMPTTECITPEEFTEWMFSLAKDQREKAKAGNKIQLDLKRVEMMKEASTTMASKMTKATTAESSIM